jgi:hypothetical protein
LAGKLAIALSVYVRTSVSVKKSAGKVMVTRPSGEVRVASLPGVTTVEAVSPSLAVERANA